MKAEGHYCFMVDVAVKAYAVVTNVEDRLTLLVEGERNSDLSALFLVIVAVGIGYKVNGRQKEMLASCDNIDIGSDLKGQPAVML